MIEETRYAKKIVYGEYIDIPFSKLISQDKFNLYESNGTPVHDENNNYDFVATSDAYINELGVWQIDIEE